jgi:hypothetical protein
MGRKLPGMLVHVLDDLGHVVDVVEPSRMCPGPRSCTVIDANEVVGTDVVPAERTDSSTP